jgi:predicted NodU family carbamoyl transferase
MENILWLPLQHEKAVFVSVGTPQTETGVPVVMNTSFNLRGEAIVNTPTNAVRTFFSSGMQALVIGSYMVEK